MKKCILSMLAVLMIIISISLPTKSVNADSLNPAEACRNIDISLLYQNKDTNRVTFEITGTPGNRVQFSVHSWDDGNYSFVDYFNIPSSGVLYRSMTFSDGYYRAYVYQYSPCSDNDAVLFRL
ncbi:hypothetical protein [Virgibacillus kimchii]